MSRTWTWDDSTKQVDAGNNAHVTSIGNTLDSSKIAVASSAVIDEANLMSIESTHLGAAPANEVALLLTSTDDERASYVSTSFQPDAITVDGSDEDWNGGNALNPSGYAMPGVMSGDGTDDFLVTYIEGDGIYFGMTNSDLSNSDVLIYPTPVAVVPMSATTASVEHTTCPSTPTTCCGLTAKAPTTSTATASSAGVHPA